MKKQTTIELKGKQFPFYRTNRGQFDFENAGYTSKQIADGKMSAMFAFIYYSAKACAKRAGENWPYRNLDEFIDDTEENILEVFTRLKESGETTPANGHPSTEGNTGEEQGNAPAAVEIEE